MTTSIALRGRQFTGTVVSSKMNQTVTVEWERRYFVKKYQRYERRKSKVMAHNPQDINAKEGDMVTIKECRPLSKTKHFVVVSVQGQQKGYDQEKEAREQAKIKHVRGEKKDVEQPAEQKPAEAEKTEE